MLTFSLVSFCLVTVCLTMFRRDSLSLVICRKPSFSSAKASLRLCRNSSFSDCWFCRAWGTLFHDVTTPASRKLLSSHVYMHSHSTNLKQIVIERFQFGCPLSLSIKALNYFSFQFLIQFPQVLVCDFLSINYCLQGCSCMAIDRALMTMPISIAELFSWEIYQ